MENKEIKYIPLTIKHREVMVPIDSILYAQIEDKLCTIHITVGDPICIFLPIESLEAMLPPGHFIRISRNCLVSLDHIKDINDKNVILFNGQELPYSRRRKTALLLAFQERLNKQSASLQTSQWKFDLFEEFRCMDHCPFPFCIVEVDSGITQDSLNFLVRYANDPFAALIRKPLPEIIHTSVFTFALNNILNYIPTLRRAALEGVSDEYFISDTASEILFHVQCYQPHYGFCALILTPTRAELQFQ